MNETGIVRNEVAGEKHAAAWAELIGVQGQKDQLLAWAVLTLKSAGIDRTSTAVNRLAVVQGPPGTGKTTLARNLASPLSGIVGKDVSVLEFAAHEAMSGEHGRTQREVHRIITQVVPDLAGNEPTVLVVDEVEALAMHRGQVSLETNPVDVHRTTDAAITALDVLADISPNVVTVMTTNFPDLVDDALRSRSDITITVPLPNTDAITEILQSTLAAWATEFPELKKLADATTISQAAKHLATNGVDARQARKFVLDVLSSDLDLAADPGRLTVKDLIDAAHARRSQR